MKTHIPPNIYVLVFLENLQDWFSSCHIAFSSLLEIFESAMITYAFAHTGVLAREPKWDSSLNFFNGLAGQCQQNKLLLITFFFFV